MDKESINYSIISNPLSVTYLTGLDLSHFRSPYFLVVDTNNSAKLILGNSEVLPDSPQMFEGGILQFEDYNILSRMVAFPDYVSREAKELLRRNDVLSSGKIGMEYWHLPYVYVRSFFSNNERSDAIVDISPTLLDMRKIKGTDEIDYITKATNILDFAYAETRKSLKAGVSELLLFSRFEEAVGDYCAMHFERTSHLKGGIVSGPRTIDIGGPPTHRKIKHGDTVISDLQTAYNGYWSDMARTWAIETLRGSSLRKVRSVLLNALSNAEEILKPGTIASDVYNVISKTIIQAGFNSLPHHAGHGLGLCDQEYPFLIPNSNDRLEANMVLSIEPGIYDKSTGFGVRIENVYLITEGGCREISKSSTRVS